MALTFIVLLPTVAFAINLAPIVRNRRAGENLLARPLNLVLVVATLLPITAFVIGVIIDQYPCWLGVPNCD